MSDEPKIKIGPLDTVGGTATELGRVYREMRRGTLEGAKGERLARVLTMLRGALEVSDIERRLMDLETKR